MDEVKDEVVIEDSKPEVEEEVSEVEESKPEIETKIELSEDDSFDEPVEAVESTVEVQDSKDEGNTVV